MNEIKNLKKAAERVKLAAKNKEKIIIYGDSDLDGIASVVILEEVIKNLGGEVFLVMFPDRENDGYGINAKAINILKEKAPALFITVDLGIGNVKEVNELNDAGFEVIIIDHHQILDGIPNAKIIVDPQFADDLSDSKYLCNTGIIFKLAEKIFGENFSESVKNSFLELTALATVSDMVSQIKDNKIFIDEGLKSLENSFRPGLRVFWDILGEGEKFSGGYLKIISALNAAESADFKNESYNLLVNSSPIECLRIAENLISKIWQKQQNIKMITEEIERRISKKPGSPLIFEGDPAWKLTLAGPAASIIAAKYEKPTFVFKKGGKESCGSARSLKDGRNSVEAMKSCKDFLITFGGHPKASGFRLKTENLQKFEDCLKEYFKK